MAKRPVSAYQARCRNHHRQQNYAKPVVNTCEHPSWRFILEYEGHYGYRCNACDQFQWRKNKPAE